MGNSDHRPVEAMIDDWLSPPEYKVAFECDQCGGEIYVGEEYLETEDGDKIHCECKYDWLTEHIVFERAVAE